MNAVHDRCVLEAREEQQNCVNSSDCEPKRLFAHGLPGSGKTQVMHWLAAYFQEVWGWESGVHFVYLAPMNSMAARINGFTVHSWGEIEWSTETATGSRTFKSGSCNARDMSSMSSKCEWCRWVLIDECEATGAGILGSLEQNVAEATRKRWYKYRGGIEIPEHLRIFGGLNIAMFGDLWQLPPVSQVSIMANPFRARGITDHHARKILQFFWQRDELNGFSEKGLFEFTVSKRFDDSWYSGIIDECRAGHLSDEAYNFLHGYPTLSSYCEGCSGLLKQRKEALQGKNGWVCWQRPRGHIAQRGGW